MFNDDWAAFRNLFSQLRNDHIHSNLTISPTTLDPISIVLLICIFVARSALSALGLGTPFTLFQSNHDAPQTNDHEFALPDITLSMPLRHQTVHAKLYAQAINPTSPSSVDINQNNSHLCLFLAALSEPAMLLLLGKKGCPVKPLGAVNVRNRFELLEPELCRSIFSDIVSHTELASNSPVSVVARFSGPARRARRGLEIDVEVDIVLDRTGKSTTTTTEFQTALFRQIFTMLQFMKFKDQHPQTQPKATSLDLPKSTAPRLNPQSTLSMPSQSPRAWARLCKDYNPIHFSSLLAKLLGQPGKLAHGNHAVGICVQAISGLIAASSEQALPGDESSARNVLRGAMAAGHKWFIETRFRRPIVLPAKIGYRFHEDGEGFDVVDARNGKVCVEVEYGSMS